MKKNVRNDEKREKFRKNGKDWWKIAGKEHKRKNKIKEII